jgi:hypothetical protein
MDGREGGFVFKWYKKELEDVGGYIIEERFYMERAIF